MHIFLFLCVTSWIKFQVVESLRIQDFIPYGVSNGDEMLPKNDDGYSNAVSLPSPMSFFNYNATQVFVNNNGDLTFDSALSQYDPSPFPLLANTGIRIIAPFWSDIDTRPADGGSVYYRTVSNSSRPQDLLLFRSTIRKAFPGVLKAQTFEPLSGFVASWIAVGYFSQKVDKLNTFQTWLAWNSNTKLTYSCNLYEANGLQWLFPTSGKFGQVGYDAGDSSNYYILPGSGTANMTKLTSTSNVNVPGLWCFQISNGTVIIPPGFASAGGPYTVTEPISRRNQSLVLLRANATRGYSGCGALKILWDMDYNKYVGFKATSGFTTLNPVLNLTGVAMDPTSMQAKTQNVTLLREVAVKVSDSCGSFTFSTADILVQRKVDLIVNHRLADAALAVTSQPLGYTTSSSCLLVTVEPRTTAPYPQQAVVIDVSSAATSSSPAYSMTVNSVVVSKVGPIRSATNGCFNLNASAISCSATADTSSEGLLSGQLIPGVFVFGVYFSAPPSNYAAAASPQGISVTTSLLGKNPKFNQVEQSLGNNAVKSNFCTALPPAATVKVASTEAAALLAFKAGITSDPLGVFTGWLTSNPCIAWQGLICNDVGNVLQLSLSSKQLKGTMPSQLSLLKRMKFLDLHSNYLSGAIPSTLDSLKVLETIDLSSNALSGSVPDSILAMVSLKILNLSQNLLSGPLPSVSSTLKLTFISMANNFLSGSPQLLDSATGLPFCLPRTSSSTGLFLDNNCLNFTSPSLPCYAAQRSSSSCSAFCDAAQYQGACGGHGRCVQQNITTPSTCICDVGYDNAVKATTCVFSTPSLGLSATGDPVSQSHASGLFRYASSYFTNNKKGAFKWSVASSWNWADELDSWPIKDQKETCASCWAFSTAAAVESAMAITLATESPTLLSEQQLVDCATTDYGCLGGLPENALEYAANHWPLNTSAAYPYKAANRTRSCPSVASVAPGIGYVSHYESVNFFGWFGTLLAVQQQPVIVAIEASSPEFINYKSGIFSRSDCYANGVDHSVLLVGYDLTSTPPYWIIRNSWGKNWGEGGYIRLAIGGEDAGICGIDTVPAMYPIVKKPNDPCNLVNYGQTVLDNRPGDAGTLNPCGRFSCTPVGPASYTCNCKPPFVGATNPADGSPTCVPASPCSFFPRNPCGVGSCVNGNNGTYACVCPLGFVGTTYVLGNAPTCIPALLTTGPQTYTVPASTNGKPAAVPCSLVYLAFGLSRAAFLGQNTGSVAARCQLSNGTLSQGTVVNITNAQPCSVSYSINKKDSCVSVANLFQIPALSGRNSPNPDLNCNSLVAGQQVCVKRGPPMDTPQCTKFQTLSSKEDCNTIIAEKFHGSAIDLFALNPGLYCDNLVTKSDSKNSNGEQICLSATALGFYSRRCSRYKASRVKSGETCRRLIKRYFEGKPRLFRAMNGRPCVTKHLRIGAIYCHG